MINFLDNTAATTGVGVGMDGAANLVCSNEMLEIVRLVGKVISVFQIAIPIILVVIGLVSLGKAVVASKDDEVKKATSGLIKKLILGAAIFFIVAIVKLVIGLVNGGATPDKCWNVIVNPWNTTSETEGK